VHFFTNEKGVEFRLSEHLAIYILSLLDPKSLRNVSLANKEWNKMVHLTRHYMSLLPTIRSIPLFSEVTLDVLKLKLMAGGMTNATYRIKLSPSYAPSMPQTSDSTLLYKAHDSCKKWVLRIPGDVSLFSVDRGHEKHNALQATRLGLNVPISYFNGKSGLQVTEFIDDVHVIDKNALERADILKTLAAKAKFLHTSERFLNDTAVFERNENLLMTLKNKVFEFPDAVDFIAVKMNYLKRLFSTYQIDCFPCHNDSTPLNYMLSSRGEDKEEIIHQIDWEYSSNNDFLWDLAYFAIESKLTPEQEYIYLDAYFGQGNVSESVWAWYTTYKPVIEWWITLWSWMQLTHDAKAVSLSEYKKLGEERYQKTLYHLESDEFNKSVALIESGRDSEFVLNPRPFSI
jgi:thiamine kinase-like enzyme